MARRRDINDIDDDEDGLFDYSGESNDDKSKDILPEDAFRHRPAPDIGTVDTSQPHQYSILREDDDFRGELPKASTHLKMLEKLQELFPEMVEGVHWDLTEGNSRNVLDFLVSIRVTEFS